MTQVVLNGNAYSDDGSSSRDMQYGGFRQWLLPMLSDATAEAGQGAGSASDAAQAADASAQAADASAQQAMDVLQEVINTGSGWSPVLQIAVDGERHVLQVKDWTGGRGTKPAVGYLSATGVVPAIANGLNIRGAVAYSDLTGKPTLGTAASLNVPTDAGGAATADQVVRGDDPRLGANGGRPVVTLLTSGTTWTAPANLSGDTVKYRMSGGGASASSGWPYGGSAAGAGGYCEGIAAVVPGENYAYMVGAPGATVTVASIGNAGGNTTMFGATAFGAPGASNADPIAGLANPGGSWSGADWGLDGGSGFTAGWDDTSYRSCSGCNPLGTQADGTASAGSAPTGYGSGSVPFGGPARPGCIILEYFVS